MSASVCDIRVFESEPCDLNDVAMFARGVSVQKERRCPNCDSLIYSRRHKLCGVCAEPLPASILFSEEQAERIESLLDEERQRHRMWLNRFEN